MAFLNRTEVGWFGCWRCTICRRWQHCSRYTRGLVWNRHPTPMARPTTFGVEYHGRQYFPSFKQSPFYVADSSSGNQRVSAFASTFRGPVWTSNWSRRWIIYSQIGATTSGHEDLEQSTRHLPISSNLWVPWWFSPWEVAFFFWRPPQANGWRIFCLWPRE